jgi:hypothetical protein
MVERDAMTRLRRRSTPAADSANVAAPSEGATFEPSADSGMARAPIAGFDIGSIGIFPPEPQIGPEGGDISAAVADRIQTQQGGGAPLAPTVQRRMEGTFGHSLADVRVHADGESDTLSRSLSARAFTLGSDIFLGREATRAGAEGGDRLLAHELTHVVQQRGTAQSGPLTVGPADDAHEREAARVTGAMGSQSVPIAAGMANTAPGATIQRDYGPDPAPTSTPFLGTDQGPVAAQEGLVASWEVEVDNTRIATSTGGQGADREISALAGDEITVRAILKAPSYPGAVLTKADILPADDSFATFLRVAQGDDLKIVTEQWTDDVTYTWVLVPAGGSVHKVSFGLMSPLEDPAAANANDRHEITITTVDTDDSVPVASAPGGESDSPDNGGEADEPNSSVLSPEDARQYAFDSMVGGLRTMFAPPGAPSATPAIPKPSVATWWHVTNHMGTDTMSDLTPPSMMMLGEPVVVEAQLAGPPYPDTTLIASKDVSPVDHSNPANVSIVESRPDDRTYRWVITPIGPGQFALHFQLTPDPWAGSSPYGPGEGYHNLVAYSDLTWFKGRCSTAQGKMDTLYHKGKAWFDDCYLNYMHAYKSFDTALGKQRDAEKLGRELLLGALFAVGGGAIGGAIGGRLKDVEEAGVKLEKALGSVQFGALTDASKDLTKYVARLPTGPLKDKIFGSGGGGGSVSGAQASTNASQAGVAQGAGNVAAINPLEWSTEIDKRIELEIAEVAGLLTSYHEYADTAIATHSPETFDWDPEQVIADAVTIAGTPFDQLGTAPDAIAYEASMWRVWLENYAYTIKYINGKADAEPAVGKKLRDEIDRVAQKFGEDADTWIERYGGPLRESLKKKAEDMPDYFWSSAVSG